MPGWNPSSATNTLEQTFRIGWTECRKRIADKLEDALKAESDLSPLEILRRIRSGELDAE